MARVSTIVAAYNARRYLAQALESILGQSCPPDEIIIVDDGSTDGTDEVAAGFGEAIRYCRTANLGPAGTRNHGITMATGELVSFLDADDLWLPTKQEQQLEALARSGARFCIGQVQMVWEEQQSAAADYFRDHPRGQPIPGYATIALMAERSLFDEIGLLNTTLWCADSLEWFSRAEQRGLRPLVLEDTLVLHRVHDASLTGRQRQVSIDEHARVLRQRITDKRAAGKTR